MLKAGLVRVPIRDARRGHHGTDWTLDQLRRRDVVLAGGTVVANQTPQGKGWPAVDAALIDWAKQGGRWYRIDNGYPLANPHFLRHERERDQVVDAYSRYILHSPDLSLRLPELRGMVLGCWCHPLRCHGHVLIDLLLKNL
jgi:hypothetical protein